MLRTMFFAAVMATLLTASLALYGIFEHNLLGYLFSAIFVALLFLPRRQPAITIGSFSIATLLLMAVISLTGLYDSNCYHPGQVLAAYDVEHGVSKFAPDNAITMKQRMGDLGAAAKRPVPRIARDITFITDSRGYRNARELSDQQLLFAGGDFIAGFGNTQEHMLSETMERDHGISAYTIATPGTLPDHIINVDKMAGQGRKIILFLDENNDFRAYEPRFNSPAERVIGLIRTTDMARLFRMQIDTPVEDSDVRVLPLENREIAFHQKNMTLAATSEPLTGMYFNDMLSLIRNHVAAVVFIPTKYRVYAELLDKGATDSLPQTHWNALKTVCDTFGIPVHNLTPDLKAAALLHWKHDKELIYWADDTRWNPRGVEAAAASVNDFIREQGIL